MALKGLNTLTSGNFEDQNLRISTTSHKQIFSTESGTRDRADKVGMTFVLLADLA
jgi:hypothetical protein